MAACAKTAETDMSAFAGPVLTGNSAKLTSPSVTVRLTTPDWPKSVGLCPFVSTVGAALTATDSTTPVSVSPVNHRNKTIIIFF